MGGKELKHIFVVAPTAKDAIQLLESKFFIPGVLRVIPEEPIGLDKKANLPIWRVVVEEN